MAMVKATEDVLEPHQSGRAGTFHLVARKGQMYDEARGKNAKPNLVTSGDAEPVAENSDGDTVAGYDALKVAELRSLADERALEHDGLKKDELVELLEQDDAGL